MASGQKRSNKPGNKTASRAGSSRRASAAGKSAARQSMPMDGAIRREIILISVFALAVFLFLCNFGIGGVAGNQIRKVMFGLFGMTAYLAPVLFFLGIVFQVSNKGSRIAVRKLAAAAVLFLLLGVVCDLVAGAWDEDSVYHVEEIYKRCSEGHNGGGVLAGSLAFLGVHFLSVAGTVLLLVVMGIICFVILTDKSFVSGVRSGGQMVYERTMEDVCSRRERARQRREEQERIRQEREEERRLLEEEEENRRILRMDRKAFGVSLDTTLREKTPEVREGENLREVRTLQEEKILLEERTPLKEKDLFEENRPVEEKVFSQEAGDDMHEITLEDFDEEAFEEEIVAVENMGHEAGSIDFGRIHITSAYGQAQAEKADGIPEEDWEESGEAVQEFVPEDITAEMMEEIPKAAPDRADQGAAVEFPKKAAEEMPRQYLFPPLKLLQKGSSKDGGDSAKRLRETAIHLQKTLATFGVKVTITDISQGPSVTRYELQPEQGVKVSRIVGLADDIKLNLAATDIRIEAPIPGKAAVGIEVPNKENSMVALRDLLESREFQEFPSRLAFAVGKDIGGKTVVADIARMPHMLIAGSTGSGKSVCINTLIMSILYKADPSEVKLIMIDPKVVELSVYNGIPHLLIPVVTDPKKAAAALHWGVTEMEERYRQFAEYNVRDLKGFNQAAEKRRAAGEENVPARMPQIVIIVDELADLMMVAPGEVEASICRLAQLARAAGIHLIIATQRPSVDVITGLIKANMPSRVAFAVSSGVDSRTILDMNGAEKLLGKGDMLFYPQGYSKPARVQGSFVSDSEVSDVVDFLKNQAIGNVYSRDVEERIQSTAGGSSAGGTEGSRDQYFTEAGKFIIDKDKASIGMLQRVFKIGFNRAARIMDQLCEAGVVGEEEGTKPRKVLMSMEQFEQLIEEEV
ncbi:MAG: DNA translocase FtsK [Lachnospiraceae bacterium]|nr:DNA translocase FtsK [Lachnospiraceae bacterium]